MRPVDRGDVPQENNTPKLFTHYDDAKRDLVNRIGDYCSYCERQLSTDCAVEHVQPKKGSGAQPHLELQWSNFLLACRNCNSTKGHKAIALQDYFWPDVDNTFLAFTHSVGGVVNINSAGLTTAQIRIAQNTMILTGFALQPVDEPTMADRRWNSRRDAWEMAQDSLNDLQVEDTPLIRDLIVRGAKKCGHFSIWMAVFSSDINMRLRLIAEFPNTAGCFDANGNPLPRVGGQI